MVPFLLILYSLLLFLVLIFFMSWEKFVDNLEVKLFVELKSITFVGPVRGTWVLWNVCLSVYFSVCLCVWHSVWISFLFSIFLRVGSYFFQTCRISDFLKDIQKQKNWDSHVGWVWSWFPRHDLICVKSP